MEFKKFIIVVASSVLLALTLVGCSPAKKDYADNRDETNIQSETEIQGEEIIQDTDILNGLPEPSENQPEQATKPSEENPPVQPAQPTEPKEKKISYITVTVDGVNIRSGGGTSYSVLGTAEKLTLYANLGEENGWFKTQYKNRTAYISGKYCSEVNLTASESKEVEAVISEGAKLLGTPYVYGAVRLHDGKGNMYKGFSVSEFDCSSLMQYVFYKGAGTLLQVNTRTQIYQGTTVQKSNLKRGDLIFFTNSSRKNNTGIERVGHVALYLGENYILHTASDYAKIEQISSTRWGYYIQAQRII